jgi:hypothetical protein
MTSQCEGDKCITPLSPTGDNLKAHPFFLLHFFHFSVLGIKQRALGILGNYSTTELQPHPFLSLELPISVLRTLLKLS